MLKKTGFVAMFAAGLLLPCQAVLADPHAGHHEGKAGPLHAAVIDTAGKEIGNVELEATPHGVLISVAASGLPEGEHAIHIHAKGVCDPASGFGTAGGHFEPGTNAHGFKDAAGPHAGDMPNQFVDGDGKLRAEVLNSAVTLGEGANSLLDEDGSALVIHEGADDYASQPTGNAGGRLACAVISSPKI